MNGYGLTKINWVYEYKSGKMEGPQCVLNFFWVRVSLVMLRVMVMVRVGVIV